MRGSKDRERVGGESGGVREKEKGGTKKRVHTTRSFCTPNGSGNRQRKSERRAANASPRSATNTRSARSAANARSENI